MNKTLLICRHEFITFVRRVGFIVMALAVPLLGLLGIGVYHLISARPAPATAQAETIGYVDDAGGFEGYTKQGTITLRRYENQQQATAALVRGDIAEYFVIPRDYASVPALPAYTLQRQMEAPPETLTAINNFLNGNLLAGKVSPAVIEQVEAPLNLVTTRLTETGAVATEQGGSAAIIIPLAFAILLVLSILISSSYLLQGLGDEKENRLLEILLSSVSTGQLLTGKVVGIGAAALLQVGVWLVSAPLLLNLASSSIGGFISTIKIPANFLLLGTVYFVLGYLLFAVISAGIGAISPTTREAQQLSAVFGVIAICPVWFMSLTILYPNSLVWVALTIFPLTSPVLVMERFGLSDIPAWQIAASMALMVLSIVGVLLVSSRIFRAYLLMYGKRPGLREVIRSLRAG